jgi:hypothetical protein
LQRLASHHGTHPRRRCDAAPCALKALTPTTPLTTSVCTSTRAQRTTLGERTCPRVLPHPCTRAPPTLHLAPTTVQMTVLLLCTLLFRCSARLFFSSFARIASLASVFLHFELFGAWGLTHSVETLVQIVGLGRGASLTLCTHTGANRCTSGASLTLCSHTGANRCTSGASLTLCSHTGANRCIGAWGLTHSMQPHWCKSLHWGVGPHSLYVATLVQIVALGRGA